MLCKFTVLGHESVLEDSKVYFSELSSSKLLLVVAWVSIKIV